MSLTVATWIGAVATVALAVGAFVTVHYARKAFLEQAEEVRTLKSQLEEQSREAGLLERQLREQQDFNEKQAPVVALQVKELEASLAERKQEASDRRRAQASRVFIFEERGPDLRVTQVQVATEGARGNVVIAHVKKTSEQPIYGVAISWREGSVPCGVPDQLGTLSPRESAQATREIPGSVSATPEEFGAVALFRDRERTWCAQGQTASSTSSRQARNHRTSGNCQSPKPRRTEEPTGDQDHATHQPGHRRPPDEAR